MSFFRLIIASLVHYWRMNLAVACGTAVGTAVLTGALAVGDSMRGSLRALLLDRLGRVDQALVIDRFFRAELADELSKDKEVGSLAPVILLRASLANPDAEPPRRANRVEVIGCDDRFWKLGAPRPDPLPAAREIVLNRSLTEKLQVRPGDAVMLRLPRPGAIPAESALGNKRQTVGSYRLTVKEVLADEGLGRFGLQPHQQAPLHAYVPLGWLQERLEQPDRVNALLLAQAESGRETIPLRPQLADYGLHCEQTPRGYFQITSARMILPGREEKAILSSAADSSSSQKIALTLQPAFTYLANTLAAHGREIPYSTITAIDFTAQPPLGPFLDRAGKPAPPLGDDEIALNSWAAEDLQARLGDTIEVTYFEPESVHGEVRETTKEFRLAAIVQLAGAAADRHLTPAVKGITDEKTMADWDPPFPFDATRIRPKDEAYWNKYGPTPKAFVALATGRRLWGSRFGRTTAIRIAADNRLHRSQATGLNENILERFFVNRINPQTLGFVWQPVREQGLRAAEGTTPFQWLFLGLSFFIIAAALMLVLLLFRLGVEQRAWQIGLLLAVGWTPRQVRRLLLVEALGIAVGGALLGVIGGVGYAALMLWGLHTWWLATITTPFLQLSITPVSLASGFGISLLAATGTMVWATRRIGQSPPRQLLAGRMPESVSCGEESNRKATSGATAGLPSSAIGTVGQANRGIRAALSGKTALTPALSGHRGAVGERGKFFFTWLELVWILVLLAHLPAWWLLRDRSELETGAFFGSGALVLALTLLVVRQRLRRGATGAAVRLGGGNVLRLALRNAARNPGRSTLTVGLMATAVFLIVAMSVFRVDPDQQTLAKSGGNGGFALVAESDQPLYQNLDTPEGRAALGFTEEEEKRLQACRFYALRVQGGEDASCLNLYQPTRPRMLGIPAALRRRGGFAWATAPAECENPWTLLSPELQSPSAARPPPIPVILEKNTANYSLHLWGGPGQQWNLPNRRGESVPLTVAALLGNSLFQGDLLVAEENLVKMYPDLGGYRFFLIETPPEEAGVVQGILERRLGDYGFAPQTSGRRLGRFLAVQNTYLSAFQSLGGLGLLLGTLGLAVVQLRGVVERRGELALLRATGFRRRTLAALVLWENAVLLALGIGSGALAALFAILPPLANRQALIPWTYLAEIVGFIFLIGLLAGGLAVRRAVQTPLLATLRKEG